MSLSETNNFSSISSTAFMASLCRQFTNLPYAKEFAQLVEKQGLVDVALSQHVSKAFVGIINLEARYKAINQIINNFQITQIIELGSGLIPRGTIMSDDPNITFIESDLPALIHYKKELVQQLIRRRSNLHFLEIDATNQSHLIQINKYFKKKQPILIVCEGLLIHLTRPEQLRVCTNIREMLSVYGGAWITSDFTFTSGLKKSRLLFQNNSMFLSQIQGTLDRIIISPEDEFQTLEQTQQFVIEQGFNVTKYSILELVGRLSCLDILKIDAFEAEKTIANQYVFVLTSSHNI